MTGELLGVVVAKVADGAPFSGLGRQEKALIREASSGILREIHRAAIAAQPPNESIERIVLALCDTRLATGQQEFHDLRTVVSYDLDPHVEAGVRAA